MPTPPTLQVIIDYPQRRLLKDRLALLVDGRQWDFFNGTGMVVDAVTRTGFLEPLANSATWQTTTSGDYARLRKTDYALITSSKWVENQIKMTGDYYLHSLDVNEVVTTATPYPKNQPWFLSWVSYNPGNSSHVQMECGWGPPAGDSTVSLRFWSDGRVDVFKGGSGVPIANGSISGKTEKGQATPAQSMSNRTVDVYLIPCRKGELLILSNQGEGFSVSFDDIDRTVDDPTITDADTFFWDIPVGQATVQLAPMKFRTEGFLLGPVTKLRRTPAVGEAATATAFYDLPGLGTGLSATASLVRVDGVTAFVPDGALNQCRIRVDLAGDGTASPFVYGAKAVFPHLTALTDGSEQADITAFVRRVDLVVPDSPSDVRCTLTMDSPQQIEAAGVADFLGHSNRPIQVRIDGAVVFAGRTLPVDAPERWNDDSRVLTVECEDEWAALRRYQMMESTPVDGYTDSAAINEWVLMSGFVDSDVDIEVTAAKVSSVGQTSQGEWALLPDVGDTPAKHIEDLWEQDLKDYQIGFYYKATGRQFILKAPTDTPVANIFLSKEDAYAYLIGTGMEPVKAKAVAYQYVWHHFKGRPIPPSANEIFVYWWDRRNGALSAQHFVDLSSQDPTLSPSLRPPNWTGDKLRIGKYDLGITSESVAQHVCEQYRDRATVQSLGTEGEAQFIRKADLTPAWRGDVINTPGKGRLRIISFSGAFEREWDSGNENRPWTWRPFLYTLRRIKDAVEL